MATPISMPQTRTRSLQKQQTRSTGPQPWSLPDCIYGHGSLPTIVSRTYSKSQVGIDHDHYSSKKPRGSKMPTPQEKHNLFLRRRSEEARKLGSVGDCQDQIGSCRASMLAQAPCMLDSVLRPCLTRQYCPSPPLPQPPILTPALPSHTLHPRPAVFGVGLWV